MKCALIALSREGAALARIVARSLPSADVFVHVAQAVSLRGDPADRPTAPVQTFRSIMALTKRVFRNYCGLVYFAPCGVVARALAPQVKHKLRDPAVVVVDAGGRYAISLLSGHEGGANELALRVANILGAEPVVTTTTEALKTAIVGVGCRRGVAADRIVTAVCRALRAARVSLAEVRVLASADIKAGENGLLEAARILRLPLRFISADELRSTAKTFRHSRFVQSKVALPAVAEPAALLAGRRTRLVLPKRAWRGVTVAIARESC
ncbi:MAG: cobalamin biosynthesis protein, partial [Planctomycetota bacterium]